MLNQFILLSREELISKIFQLTNDNKILRSDLLRYQLMFNCYENYINFLQQIRDKNKVEYNVKESQLKERLIAFESIKLCEIKLNIFEINNWIKNQITIDSNEKTSNNPKSDQKIGENVCKPNNGSNHNNQTLILCRNECLDESETLQNKTSQKVNRNNIIDKQSINSLKQSFDKECNEDIDTNGHKLNNSKSCDNNETKSIFESKSIEKSIDKEKRFEIELNVSEDNESITAFDTDVDSSQTEVDSHFDDNDKRKKTVNKCNYLSNKFKCDFIGCGKVYKRKDSLRDHKLSHGNANFKCDFIGCDYKTYNKRYLREHQMRHSREKPHSHSITRNNKSIERIVCNHNNCGNTYKNKYYLRRHQLSRHPQLFPDIQFIKCSKNECNYKTKRKSFMDSHLLTHSELNPDSQELECNQIGCNYKTKILRNLKKHKRAHNLIFICGFCELKFQYRERLENHISRKHTGIRPYVCSIDNCLKSYASKMGFLRHKNIQHNEALGQYKCQWNGCGKQFKLIASYKQHLIRHKGNQRFNCDWNECKRKFISKAESNDHLNTHTNNKPYVCEWPGCEKRFAINTYLSRHKKYHTNERKHVCDWPECDYATNNESNLDKHKDIHTRDLKYSCVWPHCQYKTSNHSNLVTHQKQHK